MLSSPHSSDIQNNNNFEYSHNSPEPEGMVSSKSLPPNKLSRHYRCEKCDFSTTRSRIFLCHQIIRHHDSTNIFLCNVCDYASRWRCKVTRHFNMLHRELSPLKEYDVVFKEASVVWEEHRRVRGDSTENGSDDMQELERLSEFLGNTSAGSKKNHVDDASTKISSRKKQIKSPNKIQSSNHCSQCGEKFLSPNFLTEYSVDHRCLSNEFTCEICLAILPNQSEVLNHSKEHRNAQSETGGGGSSSGDVVCICPVCGYSAPSPSLQDRHMETVHGEQALCSTGGMEGHHDSPSLSGCHSSNSLNTPQMNNDISGETMSNSPDWEQAQSIDSNGEMSSSGDKCKSKGDLSITDSRRRYRCNVCAATFPWHGDLAEHLKLEHGMEKSRDWRGKAGSFRCTSCKYVAKYQSELRRHMRLHLGVKPFGCVFCQYRSAWKGDLKRHIESHHRDRFTNDFQLCKIMARYKNNAGTADGTVPDNNSKDENFDDDGDSSMLHSEIFYNSQDSLVLPDSITDSCNLLQDGLNTPNRRSVDFGSNRSSPLPKSNSLNTSEIVKENSPANKTTNNAKSDPLPSYKSVNNSFSADSPTLNPIVNHPYDNPLLTAPQLSSLAAMSPDQIAFNKQAQNLFSCHNLLFNANMFSQLMLSNPEAFATPPFPVNGPNNASSTPFLSHTDVKQFNSSSHGQDSPTSALPQLIDSMKDYDNTSVCKASPNLSDGAGTSGRHSNNGSASGSVVNAKSEQFKRFKCSGCGHRSNWKWDINKHIKVAHPERSNIKTIMLSLEEARSTLSNYLSSARASKNRIQGNGTESEEGYYRPYKCSLCGHRSNWKWDVNKHIKQLHQGGAHVITLSMDDAKKTIGQYKDRRRQAQLATSLNTNSTAPSFLLNRNKLKSDFKLEQSSPQSLQEEAKEVLSAEEKPSINNSTSNALNSGTNLSSDPSPRIDTLRLKRFKCSVCGYRSNYRSDIARHNRRKHNGLGHVIILDELEAKTSLDTYMRDFPQRSHSFNSKLGQFNLTSNENSLKDESDHSKPSLTMNMSFVWKCCLCPFSHKDRLNALDHVSKEHRPAKPFSCKLCSYGTDYRNSLIRHIKAKHPHRTDIMHCIKQNLKKVRANKEEFTPELSAMNLSTEQLSCHICSKSFESYPDYLVHIQSHVSSDEELFELYNSNPAQCSFNTMSDRLQCPNCPYSTFRQDIFKVHQLQHWKDCGYANACSYCSYKSSQPTWIKNHENLHLDVMSTMDATDLRIHKRGPDNYNEDMPLDFTIKKSDSIQDDVSENENQIDCKLSYSLNSQPVRLPLKRKFGELENEATKEETTQSNNLIKRIRLHNNSEVNKELAVSNSQFHCPSCPFISTSVKDFVIHRSGHQKYGRTFNCHKCGYRARSRYGLKKHDRVHSVGYRNDQKSHSNLSGDSLEDQTQARNKLAGKLTHHLEEAKQLIDILWRSKIDGRPMTSPPTHEGSDVENNLPKLFINQINHLQRKINQKTHIKNGY